MRNTWNHSQIRLTKVGLDPIRLVVNIMVIGVVRKQELAWVPPQFVPAVIIYRLERAEGEEKGSLANTHAGCLLREDRVKRVEEEALEGVVVERAKGIGDIETVVHGVDVAVEEGGDVEEAVHEVFPGVDEEAVIRSLI